MFMSKSQNKREIFFQILWPSHNTLEFNNWHLNLAKLRPILKYEIVSLTPHNFFLVGGTMGLFLGFSFYQALAWLLGHFFRQRNTVRLRVEYN